MINCDTNPNARRGGFVFALALRLGPVFANARRTRFAFAIGQRPGFDFSNARRMGFVFAIAIVWVASSLTGAHAQTTTSGLIRLNQIGFYPDGPKSAVVVDAPAGDFFIVTPDLADTVFAGTLGSARTWNAAGEDARQADFSDVEAEGEFLLAVPGLGVSHPFEIRPHVHQEVAQAALKAYYFQRASTRLEPAYAGRWARAAGHPDDEVIVHASAALDGRPAGTIISAPKGWYDAGDYNKYVVNSGISVGTLLMLYEHYPEYFSVLDTNIPESGNDVPDLIDEVLWNIRWMLAMQDPEDGGVYHKLTTPNFEAAVMPAQAVQPRYVVQKGTAAALDFAAVMALGARVVEEFEDELPGLRDSMITAAGAAWDWAQENPDIPYRQSSLNEQFDPDINTGEYGDNHFSDEFRWAATELFITTQQDSFVVMYSPFGEGALAAPGWPNVGTLGFLSLAHHRERAAGVIDTTEIKNRLLQLANQYVNVKGDSPYDMVMGLSGDFYWGSNSLAGNQGIVLMQAYRMTREDRYLDAAISNLDYLLGRNATGYSFVTGYGHRTPLNPHHRPSEADTIHEPVPGLLVGGPNAGRQDGCTYPSTLPAKSYVDDWCSYASNEVTINWNAPLAYLAGALEATFSSSGLPVRTDESRGNLLPAPAPVELERYPNPVSDRVHLRFALAGPEKVTLRAFDVLGREISRGLADALLSPGIHQIDLDASTWADGVYFVRLESEGWRSSRPVVVIR